MSVYIFCQKVQHCGYNRMGKWCMKNSTCLNIPVQMTQVNNLCAICTFLKLATIKKWSYLMVTTKQVTLAVSLPLLSESNVIHTGWQIWQEMENHQRLVLWIHTSKSHDHLLISAVCSLRKVGEQPHNHNNMQDNTPQREQHTLSVWWRMSWRSYLPHVFPVLVKVALSFDRFISRLSTVKRHIYQLSCVLYNTTQSTRS